MAQVILIEQNKTIHDLLFLHLTNTLGLEVIPRENAQDAIALLSILPSISLIISQSTLGHEATGEKILEFLMAKKLEIPLIILGKSTIDPELAFTIPDEKNWQQCLEATSTILRINPDNITNKTRPDFIPVPLSYFYHLDTTCCDVFIRIKKGPNEFQFVKRIHAKDTFSKEVIHKYLEQGLTSFYVAKENESEFTNFVSNQLVKRLERLTEKNLDEQVDVLGNTFDMAMNEVVKMGFTSSTIQLTDSIIDNFRQTQIKSSSVSPLFGKIVNSEHSFIYRHAHITTIIALDTLMANPELSKNIESDKEILSYVCFFHDLALAGTENGDRLAKIHTWELLENSNLSDADWDLIFNHSLESSILISKHPEAPAGVAEVIKCHHGQTNGKGFVLEPSEQLDNLGSIFFIAQEFAYELLLYKEKLHEKKQPIINILKSRFGHPDIVKIINNLDLYLKNKK